MESAGDAAAGGGTAADAGGLQALAVQLRRMNGEINRVVHGFAAEQGLHSTDVQALAAILDAETPLTPGRLRAHLGLTSGAVTACLDRLERAGHIRRSRDSVDRRVVHLHYVSDAQRTARAFFRPLATAASAARDRFSPEETAVVVRFLAALNDELAVVRDHAPETADRTRLKES
ncbi:MarR family winged helix-turn-helix transcriptional regulator [Streptomyces indicus]|uniref:DNA-binding transcriptional regulator, MarR family n=1 Tax=Streptomyces indicus TaxID=417292 RepID=A0A1G8ZIC0_9ACTN|nr:MarR family transcriptional regulator [Streptomyces indicus]SDK14753.1 DNA-binding transcriptional regulator, MarR family [Streptomyces indicus]